MKSIEQKKQLRIMKLFLVFNLIFIMGVSASVYSQNTKFTVNYVDITVKEMFDKLESQSEFRFFYNDQFLDLERKVSLNVKDKKMEDILNFLFSSSPVTYKILDNNRIVIMPKASPVVHQQDSEVSGTVTDSKGEPLIGVSIVIQGSNSGTVTDMDGHFNLKVPGEDVVLIVSYIGYSKQQVPVGSRRTFSIMLEEDTQKLDEVVVIGFGTQKKVNLTGAVGTVNAEALEARPVMTASQALQGMVPGLQIVQNNGGLENRASINIRGTATIGDGSTGGPLILIDGMEGDINAINPQDIENISVLKDAAASSVYGSRAPFGVILVTTKTGKTGKPVINYNNSFRWNQPTMLPEMMDSYTFALYFNDACTNNGQQPQFSPDHLQRILDYQQGKITNSTIPRPTNPQYWADGYSDGNDNVDWYKALYRDWTFSQEHNFSVNGGSERINYYASLNYLDQNGLMVFNQDTYDRYSATAKMNIKLNDWVTLNYSNRFIREDFGRPSALTETFFSDIARQGWPTLVLYDPNGYLYSTPSPALGLRDGGRDRTQTDYLYQQGQLTIEPIKNWKTYVDFNYRIKSANRHWDSQQLFNHDVNGEPYLYQTASNVHEDQLKENYMNINAYTEYSHSLASGHNFKGMFGFQSEMMRKSAFGLQRDGIIIPSLPSVDLTTGTDSNGGMVTPAVNGEYQRWTTAGFFGRINYDFNGKYLAEVNLRYDGTSRYRQEQRWNLFPSFSLGWNIAREQFWEILADYVGTLKLRGSYGELGNQNTSSWYPTYQIMDVKASNGSWLINGAKPNTALAPGLISSLLTWERVKSWNIGLDIGAFNNRLTSSFDYYTRNTLDMVGPAPELPVSLGTAVPKANNTDLRTYGFDFEIAWTDRLKNGVGYGLKFILSDSQTKITRYPNTTGRLDTYRTGQMMGEIWGYTTLGIAKSQEEMDTYLASLPNGGQDALGNKWEAGDIMFADINGDGKIDNGANTLNSHGDLKKIGNSTPRYQFGIDLNADWKGFDLRAFFQGIMKRDYFQGSYFFWGATGNQWASTGFVQHEDYFRLSADHPLGQNLDSYYPRPNFGNGKNLQTQTRYLQHASYIRLKNLQIGYTLPNSLTERIHISKLRFYISGENLWTGTRMSKIFDPETIDGGWKNGDSYSGSVYPLSKTISLGLSVNL